MNGSIVPLRALERSAECRPGQAPIPLRSDQFNGEVGSHCSSHASLRSRISLQVRASRSRGGRSSTGPAVNVAGQPGALATWRYRFASSNGMTVTCEPAVTSVSSSAITTRQFDNASDATRWDPAPPTNETL